jgi:hypothetical protein
MTPTAKEKTDASPAHFNPSSPVGGMLAMLTVHLNVQNLSRLSVESFYG